MKIFGIIFWPILYWHRKEEMFSFNHPLRRFQRKWPLGDPLVMECFGIVSFLSSVAIAVLAAYSLFGNWQPHGSLFDRVLGGSLLWSLTVGIAAPIGFAEPGRRFYKDLRQAYKYFGVLRPYRLHIWQMYLFAQLYLWALAQAMEQLTTEQKLEAKKPFKAAFETFARLGLVSRATGWTPFFKPEFQVHATSLDMATGDGRHSSSELSFGLEVPTNANLNG